MWKLSRYYWRVSADSLVLRLPTEEDAQAIVDIYNYAVLNTTATFDIDLDTVENRKAWLRNHTHLSPAIIGEQGGTVVGWAFLSVDI